MAQETNKLFEHLHDAFPAEVLAELQGKKAGDCEHAEEPVRTSCQCGPDGRETYERLCQAGEQE